jgi:predicted aspartyl protease
MEMMTGTVSNGMAANVAVRVRGPNGRETVIRAMIDTGSTVALTLPPQVVADLELDPASIGFAQMADGSIRDYETFLVEFDWQGHWHELAVACLGTESLVGTPLLRGSELRIVYVPGGRVDIQPITS